MDCKDAQELLAAYLDGGIADPETYDAISTHLENCADCRVERRLVASTLARASMIVRWAGDNAPTPATRWANLETQMGFPQTAQPADQPLPGNNSDHRRPIFMATHNNKQNRGRRTSLVAGAASFVLALVALIAGLVLADRLKIPIYGNASAQETPTELPSTPTAVPTLEPTASSTPTLIPSPTADLAAGPGGFTEDVVDVSTLPEYQIPAGGGGGGGGGGGCPDQLAPSETVSLYEISEDDWKGLCLYDMPNASDGARFTVTLTSPSGRSFSEQYTISGAEKPPQVLPVDPGRGTGFIGSNMPRMPIDLNVHFWAAQEYGNWRVEAATAGGQIFASGTLTVGTKGPIYSVTHIDDPLDPFMVALNSTFQAGDHVLFAGRGLDAKNGQTMTLALYSTDPARSNNKTVTVIPYYATRITVTEDGTFRAEFVVGSHTSPTYFTAVFDPTPGTYNPERFGMGVSQ